MGSGRWKMAPGSLCFQSASLEEAAGDDYRFPADYWGADVWSSLRTANEGRGFAVLGTTGMLGSMVHHHLASVPNIQLKRFARPGFDAEAVVVGGEFPELAGYGLRGELYRCYQAVLWATDDPAGVERAIRINALFPHQLARAAHRHGVRLIQIATDCVFSGSRGKYTEADDHDALDVYGKTKSLGELHVPGALNIRCSIIGPEGKGRTSLMEWFLAQPAGSTVNGFTHHLWNGVTTLQFARLCERIILTEGAFDDLAGVSPVHDFRPNEVVFEIRTPLPNG